MVDTVGWALEANEAQYPDQRYRGNGKHNWEAVVQAREGHPVSRLRVPSGWLYRDDKTGHMQFVPLSEVMKHKV